MLRSLAQLLFLFLFGSQVLYILFLKRLKSLPGLGEACLGAGQTDINKFP